MAILIIIKWLGIIVLSLLLFVVALLLLILCAPIRYRIAANCFDGDLDSTARVSYLGPLVRASVQYHRRTPVQYWVKILWFTVLCDDKSQLKKQSTKDKAKKPKKSKKQAKRSKQQEDEQKSATVQTEPYRHNEQEIAQQDEPSHANEPRKKQPDMSDSQDLSASPDTSFKSQSIAEQPAKKRRFRVLVSQIVDRIKVTWNRIKRKYQRLYEHFQTSTNKARLLKKLWETETTRRSYQLVKVQLVRLLRHIKPRKVICDIHFGFGDPALTGEALAGLAVVYGLSGVQLNVRPDFEQACLEGTIFAKGRIQLILLAVIALRVFFDKYSRKTYARFHKIIGGN